MRLALAAIALALVACDSAAPHAQVTASASGAGGGASSTATAGHGGAGGDGTVTSGNGTGIGGGSVSSTGAASTSASSSSGQGGDGGAPPECLAPSDCPGADNECQTRTCTAGVCGIDFAPNGTPIAAQTAGDCFTVACDGAGSTFDDYEPSDLVPDGNECTADACTMQGPTFTITLGAYCASVCTDPPCGLTDPLADDTVMDWGVCNAAGTCLEALPQFCKANNVSYRGCDPLQPASWKLEWNGGQTPNTRCNGNSDRGYCPAGTPCEVDHASLGVMPGICQ